MNVPATPEYVAERLREAAETLRQIPAPRHGFPGHHRSAMPAPIFSFWEMWNQLSASEREERERELNETRIAPSAARIERMWQAIDWIFMPTDWLDARDRRVIWARAMRIKYVDIARRDGRSPERLRQIWIESCQRIACRQNKPLAKLARIGV